MYPRALRAIPPMCRTRVELYDTTHEQTVLVMLQVIVVTLVIVRLPPLVFGLGLRTVVLELTSMFYNRSSNTSKYSLSVAMLASTTEMRRFQNQRKSEQGRSGRRLGGDPYRPHSTTS